MALARGLPDGAPPAYGLPAKAAAAVVNHRIIEDVVVKTESIGYGSRWPNEVEIGVQRNKAAQMRVDIRTRVNGSSVVGCALIVFQSVDAVRIIVEKPYQRERVRVSQRELVQYLSNQSMNPQAPHLCAASAVQRVLWYSAASAVVQCSECCGAVQRVLWCSAASAVVQAGRLVHGAPNWDAVHCGRRSAALVERIPFLSRGASLPLYLSLRSLPLYLCYASLPPPCL